MGTHYEQFSREQSERKILLEKLNEIRNLTENLQTQQVLIENQIFEERKQACFVLLNCTDLQNVTDIIFYESYAMLIIITY